MGSALWIAISGLNASSKQLDVIGNNIANSNTMGFKAGKTYFANVLSQSLSGGLVGHDADRPGRYRGRRGHPVQPGLPRVHRQRPRPGRRRRRIFHRPGQRGFLVSTRGPGPCTSTETAISSTSTITVSRATRRSSPASLGDVNTRSAQSAPVTTDDLLRRAQPRRQGRCGRQRSILPRPSTTRWARPTPSPRPTRRRKGTGVGCSRDSGRQCRRLAELQRGSLRRERATSKRSTAPRPWAPKSPPGRDGQRRGHHLAGTRANIYQSGTVILTRGTSCRQLGHCLHRVSDRKRFTATARSAPMTR